MKETTAFTTPSTVATVTTKVNTNISEAGPRSRARSEVVRLISSSSDDSDEEEDVPSDYSSEEEDLADWKFVGEPLASGRSLRARDNRLYTSIRYENEVYSVGEIGLMLVFGVF